MSHRTVLPEPTTLLGKTSRNKELIDMSSDETNDTHLDELITIVKDGILLDTNHIEDLQNDIAENESLIFDYKAIVSGYHAKILRNRLDKEALIKPRPEKKVVTYDSLEKIYYINPPITRNDKLIALKDWTHYNQVSIERLTEELFKCKRSMMKFKSEAEALECKVFRDEINKNPNLLKSII